MWPREKDKNMKIAILGYGRFGELWARVLNEQHEVFILKNQRLKAKKVPYPLISLEKLKEIEMVFLAVPISSLRSALKEIKDYLAPKTLVLDVCSVKVYPCQWLEEILPSTIFLCGTHPLFGPDSVAAKGLAGQEIVLCPLRLPEKRKKQLKKMFLDLGLEIKEVTSEEHDRQTAFSLALVHFLGRALKEMKIKPLPLSTLGFQRLCQIKENVERDTEELFFDMQKYNPYAAEVRKSLLNSLQKIDLVLRLANGKKDDLAVKRKVLEEIDEKIFYLLQVRMEVAREIGKIKRRKNLPLFDKTREKELIKKAQENFFCLNCGFIRDVYKVIFKESKNNQKRR